MIKNSTEKSKENLSRLSKEYHQSSQSGQVGVLIKTTLKVVVVDHIMKRVIPVQCLLLNQKRVIIEIEMNRQIILLFIENSKSE